MKTIKLLSVAFAVAFAMNANAQFVNQGGNGGNAVGDEEYSYYSGYGKEKNMTNEISFYIGDGWGLGWQLRKEFNPYVALNIVGVSYMSGGFHSPDESGLVNFKLLGARGYTPSWKWIRGYVDINMGYSLSYVSGGSYKESYSYGGHTYTATYEVDDDVSHHFGLDFSVGVQLHKRIAIGYNLNFLAPGKAKTHLARISLLF